MNSMFFNKVKANEIPEMDVFSEISKIDVSDVVENPAFMAGIDGISGDTVLCLSSDEFNNAMVSSLSDQERIQPFYNKQNVGKANVPDNPFIGFSRVPNQTFGMQQNAVRTAKFVYFRYLNLTNSVSTLITRAPNQMVKNTLQNIRQELFVGTAVMKNIIRVLGNTPMPILVETLENQNRGFCQELNNAISISNSIILGLIRLNRQVNINSVNRQIVVLALSQNNIHNTLKDLRSYC